jgi:homoserine dehydrogenase
VRSDSSLFKERISMLRLGIAGLGTVGAGVCKILSEHENLLTCRAGKTVTVTAVSARDKSKDRGVDLSGIAWEDDPVALSSRADVDIVLELIGGADGVAYNLVKKALQNGKHVVSANKAMIAHHGTELARIAEEKGVRLAFEASVAGGIPILKGLKEGLVANSFTHIVGILNGTCNYMLTQMEKTGKAFDVILSEAQAQGYAEADPSFDVDGIDAAHKLAIIAAIAYGAEVNFKDVYIEGIRGITPDDIGYAKELGYKIKLLGMCKRTGKAIEQRVTPCLVPEEYPIAKVDDVFNAVIAQCDMAGKSIFEGRGAGQGPTASAVIADIIDIAAGRASHPFNMPVADLEKLPTAPIETLETGYYIRLKVVDAPGVLADITRIFRDHKISMKTLLQKAADSTNHTQIVVTTHPAVERNMQQALGEIGRLGTVIAKPHLMRIAALV